MSFSWSTFKKPIVALAPMSGVSDIAFRQIAKSWGSDITFSEFISTDAIFYKLKSHFGKDPLTLSEEEIFNFTQDEAWWAEDKSAKLAEFSEEERPYIIQLFGPTPEHFKISAKVLKARFKPDGFDINFGCPARSVVNNGAGSCLFLKPDDAKKIVYAVKEACGELPVSIKLRASYKNVSAMEFLKALQGCPFDNVTVHMRAYEQGHCGTPNLDVGKQIKEHFAGTGITILINGGINSGAKAKEFLDYTKADGVMVAQASLGNPFIFKEIKAALTGNPLPEIGFKERIDTAMRHAELMAKYKGQRGMIEMRKHLLWYFKGFPNASKLRTELSQVQNLGQLSKILTKTPILE